MSARRTNILLLQLKRIGDLVLTTPSIAAVREKFPDAHITLVVAAGSAELLPAISGVDRTFIARGQIRDAAAWFTVARRRFDYCVDFTHSDRSAFLTVLSRARKRVTAGHARLQSKLRALGYNQLVDCSLRLSHTVEPATFDGHDAARMAVREEALYVFGSGALSRPADNAWAVAWQVVMRRVLCVDGPYHRLGIGPSGDRTRMKTRDGWVFAEVKQCHCWASAHFGARGK